MIFSVKKFKRKLEIFLFDNSIVKLYFEVPQLNIKLNVKKKQYILKKNKIIS